MRVPNHKSLIVCIAVALVFAATAPQVHGMQTKPPCDEDDLSFNCGGGNDSPPPETPDPTTGPYWGSWYIDGACDWSGFVLIRRYLRNPDGTPATSPPTDPTPWGGFVDSSGRVYQTACWDGAEAEAVVEGELVSGSELLSPPEFTRNPELVGLTGLETWLWFEGATQLPPIALAWTDPATGISHNLEGRAWIESITWDLGNGDAVSTSHAAEFDDAAGLGGSLANPAATYTYETSAIQYGFEDGSYPITVTVTWSGQFRVAINGSWSDWQPVFPNWERSDIFGYEVTQIRSVLVP